MAGIAPGLTIGPEIRLEIDHLRGAKPDEDRQARPSGRGKGLIARRGHAERRVRHLVRPGRDRRVLHPIELAVVAERLSLPGLPDDLQALAKTGLTLGVRHPLRVVAAHHPAPADPEPEGAPADWHH